MRSATSTDPLSLTPLLAPVRRRAANRARRRRTAFLTLAALVFVWAVFAGAVRAQEAASADPCAVTRAAAVGSPEPLRIDHEGVSGMFFPMASARLVLCEVRELRLRRTDATLTSRELNLWSFQVEILREQVDLAHLAREAMEGAATRAEERALAAEAERDAWYRHPILWMAIGVVIAVGLVAGAVAVLDATAGP